MHNARLFLIGGAADKCLADFVQLAGGASARIAVLTHASSTPRQTGTVAAAKMQQLGAGTVTVITPRCAPALPDGVTAVFICGGNQLRLVRALERNGLAEQIRTASRRGVLIAGTSAGAAAASYVMVAGGMSDGVLRPGSLVLEKGLCLLRGVVVDTHFSQRNRENRMRAAVATLGEVAIGLDEDTAVLVCDGLCTVYGAGDVWYFERRDGLGWEQIAARVKVLRCTPKISFYCPARKD